MKIGYISDWTGAATLKCEIIDETLSGYYVLRKAPFKMFSFYGHEYLSYDISGIFLRRKEDIINIREEEIC